MSDTISISDLSAMSHVQSGPCSVCGRLGYVPYPESTTGRMDVCSGCAGSGNALTVPTRRLAEATPVLLSIVSAALTFRDAFSAWRDACDDLLVIDSPEALVATKETRIAGIEAQRALFDALKAVRR